MTLTNLNPLIEEDNKNFQIKLYFDQPNQRLKVLEYKAINYDSLVSYLLSAAEETNCGKIVMVSIKEDWVQFLARGFVLEGMAEGYLKGSTGFFMSYFLENRQSSTAYDKEQKILLDIINSKNDSLVSDLPREFHLRSVSKEDIPALASLFDQVFETYPVPVTNHAYLEKAMETKSVFKVIEYNSKIISAASAEINNELGNAEITDCATLPEFRGNNFMLYLIKALEEDMHKRGIFCLYSLARAISKGIGKVFHRQNYQYRGRLINNCNICGSYEDMNLWVKYKAPSEK